MSRPEPLVANLTNHQRLGHGGPGVMQIQLGDLLGRDPAVVHARGGVLVAYGIGAGKYDAGAKQFAAYQTVDSNDVENAVWRFLCMARAHGVDEARKSLLKVKHDARVPMMEIYALFAGQAKPAPAE